MKTLEENIVFANQVVKEINERRRKLKREMRGEWPPKVYPDFSGKDDLPYDGPRFSDVFRN